MNEINSYSSSTANTSITPSCNEFISCISKIDDVNEVSVNTMNMPVKDNDYYTCVRTTIKIGSMTISMDGYADSSSAGSTNPCDVVDKAKYNSISEVMSVLKCTMDNNMKKINDVIDITTHTESRISIPERFNMGKFLEPHTKSQEDKLYYIAGERGMSPDEFSMKVLGKELQDTTKGELAYLIQYKD